MFKTIHILRIINCSQMGFTRAGVTMSSRNMEYRSRKFFIFLFSCVSLMARKEKNLFPYLIVILDLLP